MTKLYLDLAAQAGVFVIFDCQIDNIAKAGFTGTNDQAWKDLLANLTLVKDHPALAGYYACDDCCHVKVNVDENPNSPAQMGVRGIPALFLFKDGEVVSNKTGAAPKAALKSWIEEGI